MAARSPHHLLTYAEYLTLERDSGTKHEWCAGQVYAMAGGTPEHARLSARVIAALLAALRGRGCEVFSSDLKIRVQATGLATYPDATVVCGSIQAATDDPNAVVNPTCIVEVLSPGTEAYDRGEKLWHYQQIAELRAVLFVAQDCRRLEVVARSAEDAWSRSSVEGDGSLSLGTLGVTLSIGDVFGPAA
ncbi:MAG: Uma2 family endonuclease [Polyangiaceae bacterium]